MGGLFGKKTTIDNGSIANFQINQATYGVVVPVILGTSRQSANIIDHFKFTTKKHKQKSGKGGSTATVSYTYKAAVLLALGEGRIARVGNVWIDTDTITTLAGAGLTLFDGAIGQEPWSYTLTNAPDRALPYSGLAYVAGYIDLNSNAGVKTYNFEIAGQLLDTGDGVDINPADGCKYILTALDFTDSNVHADSFSNFQLYCKASDLYITVPLTDQTAAYETINKLCEMTNTITFWSQRKIKFVPRCESEITGNGVTYTPNATPEYDLTDDDFLEDEDSKLVTWERKDNAETYNHVTVEFINRENGYETETVDYQILADINKRGLRPMSTVSYHEIHTKARAEYVAQLLAMDSCYGRNTYKFKLGIKHCLLEPGDIVTLTNTALGLSKLPVSIERKKEVDIGEYEFEAKYKPVGAYSAAKYSAYDPIRPSLDRNVNPGNTETPLIFETPFDGTRYIGIAASGGEYWGGAYVWISADDEAYEQIGEISTPSRHGVITSAISATATAVTVRMADSTAQLLSVSATAADAYSSLIVVGNEWMAYETATLIETGVYTLSGLRRGLYNTAVVAHSADESFLRYDIDGFLYPYQTEDIGRNIYIKLTSYNVFGLNTQELEDVTAYQYTIRGASAISRIERQTRSTVAGWTAFNFAAPFAETPAFVAFSQTVGTVAYWRNVTATGFEILLQETATSEPVAGEFYYDAQGW